MPTNCDFVSGWWVCSIRSSPIPDVRVRYGDPDAVQQAVCDLTERALSYDLDRYDFDDVMKEVVRQAEMTGWGIARIR